MEQIGSVRTFELEKNVGDRNRETNERSGSQTPWRESERGVLSFTHLLCHTRPKLESFCSSVF